MGKLKRQATATIKLAILQAKSNYLSQWWIILRPPQSTELISRANWIDYLKALQKVVDAHVNALHTLYKIPARLG